MSEFVSNGGVCIAYETLGEGAPVLLVHGFASNREINWRKPGWYEWLTRAGRRVIAMDNRGHGESDKPHDIQFYDEGLMAGDALAVLNALKISSCDMVGYSMGAYLLIRLMHDHPARVARAVLGGVGGTYFGFWDKRAKKIADAMLAKDPAEITDPMAQEFRRFAERAGDDLEAMAACIQRPRITFTMEELKAITTPVLIVCGENDEMAGPPERLARVFANARLEIVAGRDHQRTVGDPVFKQAAVEFLR
ncbi:MAG: alpha/beta fold hydrolase [Alphaproteobacteria bacterium]